MKKLLIFIIIIGSFNSKFFGQEKAPIGKLSVGDYIHEELDIQLISKKGTINIPEAYLNRENINYYIYYRWLNNNINDNNDSLLLIQKVANEIEQHEKKAGTKGFIYHLVVYFSGKSVSENEKILKSIDLTKNNTSVFSHIEFAITDTGTTLHSFRRSEKIILANKDHKIINMWSSLSALAGYYSVPIIKKINKERKFIGKLVNISNNIPIDRAAVAILINDKDTLAKTKTDKYGEFKFLLPEDNNNYMLSISSIDKNIQTIILATKEGKEISKLNRGANGFEYRLIPAEINRMAEVEEKEDISAAFNNFRGSKKNEIKIEENIIYGSGKFDLEEAAQTILDKVLVILKNNPNVKLNVISHTDAQGDDAENLALSLKRSSAAIDYLINKGIDKSRLNPIGKGELEIRNRCKNNVDCSDEEHSYNRRTEFQFVK